MPVHTARRSIRRQAVRLAVLLCALSTSAHAVNRLEILKPAVALEPIRSGDLVGIAPLEVDASMPSLTAQGSGAGLVVNAPPPSTAPLSLSVRRHISTLWRVTSDPGDPPVLVVVEIEDGSGALHRLAADDGSGAGVAARAFSVVRKRALPGGGSISEGDVQIDVATGSFERSGNYRGRLVLRLESF